MVDKLVIEGILKVKQGLFSDFRTLVNDEGKDVVGDLPLEFEGKKVKMTIETIKDDRKHCPRCKQVMLL